MSLSRSVRPPEELLDVDVGPDPAPPFVPTTPPPLPDKVPSSASFEPPVALVVVSAVPVAVALAVVPAGAVPEAVLLGFVPVETVDVPAGLLPADPPVVPVAPPEGAVWGPK